MVTKNIAAACTWLSVTVTVTDTVTTQVQRTIFCAFHLEWQNASQSIGLLSDLGKNENAHSVQTRSYVGSAASEADVAALQKERYEQKSKQKFDIDTLSQAHWGTTPLLSRFHWNLCVSMECCQMLTRPFSPCAYEHDPPERYHIQSVSTKVPTLHLPFNYILNFGNPPRIHAVYMPISLSRYLIAFPSLRNA